MTTPITIDVEGAYIIRATLKDDSHLYHESGVAWVDTPETATIYRSAWIANRFIADMRHHKRPGFHPEDVVDAVPLAGALASLQRPFDLGPLDDEDV